jgi:3-deoxy-manno-octulosonate cytidylyltransferase (CMP-KDO synthetase)
MSTLKTEITPDEYDDPDVVKVVTDNRGLALYFSRSLIPFNRDNKDITVYEHVGLYAYRKDFLLKFPSLPPSKLEQIEMLEQLRVLENGFRIIVAETHCSRNAGLSVDTPEDLKKIEAVLMNKDQ